MKETNQSSNIIDIDLTEPEINCGACTVAIGAHTMDEHCRESKSEPVLKSCHDCGDRIEDGDEKIEHDPKAEPPGFVYLCEKCRPITIPQAKKIAKEFEDVIEFWFDRHLKLWALTDVELAASSDWISSGNIKTMTASEFRSYVESYASDVREYHGEDDLVACYCRGPKHPVLWTDDCEVCKEGE